MLESIRESRKRKKQFWGILLIVLAVCIGLTVFMAYVWFARQQVEFDKETLCPKKGPQGLTVILIDRTDPLTVVQQEALREELDRIRNEIPIGTGIEVYSVGAIAENLLTAEGPLVCNPGRGENTSYLIGNPRLIEKRWRERFARPIEDVFAKMLQPGSSPRSPILESIQSVAIKPLGSLGSDVKYRRLVIVSDMLHNTDEFSQYHHLTPFSEFRRTQYYRKVRADLAKIEVEIIYIRREQGNQGRNHIEFWQEYFYDCRATLVHVKALQG